MDPYNPFGFLPNVRIVVLTSYLPHFRLSKSCMAAPRYNAVFVVGPSSSGKTTLCNALAKQINVSSYITEVARKVMREQGFSRDDVGSGGKLDMQRAIMSAQLQAEEEAQTRSTGQKSYVLSDRSAVDPIVYAGWCVEIDDREDVMAGLMNREDFLAALGRYRSSLFIVLRPVEEWIVDDGVRSMENQLQYTEELLDILKQLQIPYKELDRSIMNLDDRVKQVCQWLSGTNNAIAKGRLSSLWNLFNWKS